eukprot:Skav213809  [mRNA]  locus=scaffold1987:451681:451923:- [translate_table: standard]
MMNVHAIAGASKRNESLHFGVADYAASTKSRTTNIGGPNRLYGVLTDKDTRGGDPVRPSSGRLGLMPSCQILWVWWSNEL